MSLCRTRLVHLLAGLGCALIAFGTSACEPSASDASMAGEADTAQREKLPVETLTVRPRTFRETFEVPGLVETASEVRVGFEAGGRITSVAVDEGDRVERGEVLARVDADVDRARIQLLENQVESARREYERAKRLNEEGVGTKQQLDRAESALEDAKLNLEQARVALNRATVVSPVSGEIAERYAEAGEFASPGTPLVDVIDGRELEVEAGIPSSRTTAVEKGAPATVEIPPVERRLSGRIVKVPSSVDSRTRTLGVTIRLETEPDSLEGIRAGMRASVTLVDEVWEEALVVPRTSVLQGHARDEVAVMTSEDEGETGRADIRAVRTGPGAGARVVVTEGLEAGERLIVRGHRSLTSGAPVEATRHFDRIDDLPTQFE